MYMMSFTGRVNVFVYSAGVFMMFQMHLNVMLHLY